MNKEKRNINYDLIRVVSMILMIGVHTNSPFKKGSINAIILSTILFSCNNLFYMLSGRFNLTKKFHCKEDYKKYYLGKMITILFPYFFLTLFLCLWDTWDSGTWNGIGKFVKYFYVSLMQTNADTHLWFMYPLMGFLISVPFLAKMLQVMSAWEINLILGIGLLWNIVSIYFTKDFDIKFSYSGWLFAGWYFPFFLGFYCYKIINESNKRIIYTVGIIGFTVTILGRYFFLSHYKNAVDLAIAFILFTIAFYTFIEREICLKNKFIIKIIDFLSKHSFVIYMIHSNIHFKITPQINHISSAFGGFIANVLITLMISILVALILNIVVIWPIQNCMRKLFRLI